MASDTMSRVVFGRVMHRRRLPVENRFVYPVFFLLINLDELEWLGGPLFGINRRRPLALNFADHGDGGDPRPWIRNQLLEAGIGDCTGPLWLQTFPRVLGHVFNPVSFWYCQRDDGSVGAVIAEVNNTFGDRHSYLLTPSGAGRTLTADATKQLYVSPFYPVRGHYRFHFEPDFDAPRVRIDYYDQGRLQLNTAIWGKSKPLSTRTLASAMVRQPMLSLGIVARIHWQALRLWKKGVPLCSRPSSSVPESSS